MTKIKTLTKNEDILQSEALHTGPLIVRAFMCACVCVFGRSLEHVLDRVRNGVTISQWRQFLHASPPDC